MANKFLSFFLISSLLLGCSNLTVDRRLASSLDFDSLLSKGLFPTSLVGKNIFDISDRAKVFFNLPPYTNPGGVGIVPEMIKTIDEAKSSIRMSMFQFNHVAIFEALKRAVNRNVTVYITTDLCYASKAGYKESFDELRNHLDQHGQQSKSQIIDDGTSSCEGMFNHNKYMIVDLEDDSNVKAWFGSFNPTNHGSIENVELAVLVNDKKPAVILNMDFEQQLNGKFRVNKKGVYSVLINKEEFFQSLSDAEVQALKNKGAVVTYPRFKLGEAEFEFILSPKVKSLTRLIEEVYNSQSEILFSSFAIADQMLISSIINKSQSTNTAYNLFSVLALPHPHDEEGYTFVKNGDVNNLVTLFKKSPKSKTPSSEALNALKPIVEELLATQATPSNYLTPKNELKRTFHYIYPKGVAGGEVLKVRVEGIFNSKVIDEENTLKRFANHQVPIYKSSLSGELHNKLFLIDEQKTIFGSHNFSQSAENSNDELTVIINSSKLTKFLKEHLYEKTKLFAVRYEGATESFTRDAAVAITEVMANSQHKMNWNKKNADIGSFIEIYNYGDRPVNLLGFRYDDHYFPEYDNEKLDTSTLPGFQGTLVRFIPSSFLGQVGVLDYNPTNNVLMPKKTALIVGKYFNDRFYKAKFRAQFKQKYGKEPTLDDYPLLFSSGEYFSVILGDSNKGLSQKDKISLFGIDGTTVIDRFAHPRTTTKAGISLERSFDDERLRSELNSKTYSLQKRNYILKNETTQTDIAFLPDVEFSLESDWSETKNEGGTPGVVNSPQRAPSSSSHLYTIEAEIADVETNTFKQALVVIKNNKFFDITNTNNSAYPAPLVKGVLMFPGLIDTHNHIKYNTMPTWKSAKFYDNRNLWPEESVYQNGIKEIYKEVYVDWPECSQADEMEKNRCLANSRCKILKYSELKSLIGGTTSIQGSSSFDENTSDITFKGLTSYTIGSGKKVTKSKAKVLEEMLDACSNDFARNIERETWRGHDEVRTTAQSITAEAFAKKNIEDEKKFPKTPSGKLLEEFKKQTTNTFFIHLGEGIDPSSRSEWDELSYLRLAVPQTTIIHGTAFEEDEFKKMGDAGLSLAWSPTSNLLLYKKTTNIPLALKNKVNVSLGPDWSLSGTKSLLYELKVASFVNHKYFKGAISNNDLLKMVTINGAKATHVDDLLGSIAKNKLADFFLVKKDLKQNTPLETLLKLTEASIDTVFVGGEPRLGNYDSLVALNQSLGIGREIAVIQDTSCSKDLAVSMSQYELEELISNLSDKTASAFKKLNVKHQKSLGEEFSKLDPLCTDGDQRALSIIEFLKTDKNM